MHKLAIVRGSSNPLSLNSYNIQEIGFAKALIDYGISVDIFSRFSFKENFKILAEKRSQRLSLYSLKGVNLPGQQGFYPNVFYWLNKNKYSVVQLHDDTSLMTHLVAAYAKKNGMKTILWQGMYLRYMGWKEVVQKKFEFLFDDCLARNIDIFISKTNTAKKYIESKGFYCNCVLPVGIDMKQFDNSFDANFKFDACFSNFLSKNRPILLYVGNLERRRNIEFLVEVLAILKMEFSRIGLVVIGDGPDSKLLREKTKYLSLEKNVFYCGKKKQNELSSYYRSADVLLLPSEYEIFGMVMLEALFFGLPVVATPQAGPLDVLKCPWLGKCVSLSHAEWAAAIKLYLSMDKNKSIFRKKYIMQNFNWSLIARKYLKILNDNGLSP